MPRQAMSLAVFAALMGAAGVVLAALSTHADGGELGRTGAEFLILHAAAIVGIAAHIRVADWRTARALLVAGGALALGTLLFSGDLTARAFGWRAPFSDGGPRRREPDDLVLDRSGDRVCGRGDAGRKLNFRPAGTAPFRYWIVYFQRLPVSICSLVTRAPSPLRRCLPSFGRCDDLDPSKSHPTTVSVFCKKKVSRRERRSSRGRSAKPQGLPLAGLSPARTRTDPRRPAPVGDLQMRDHRQRQERHLQERFGEHDA